MYQRTRKKVISYRKRERERLKNEKEALFSPAGNSVMLSWRILSQDGTLQILMLKYLNYRPDLRLSSVSFGESLILSILKHRTRNSFDQADSRGELGETERELGLLLKNLH